MALDKFGENEDEKKEKEDSLEVVSSVKKTLEDFRAEMENFNAIDWDAEIKAVTAEIFADSPLGETENTQNLIFKKLLKNKFNIDIDAADSWKRDDLDKISWLRKVLEKNNKKSESEMLSFDDFCSEKNTESAQEYLLYLETKLTSVLKINQFFGDHLQYAPDRMNRQWQSIPRKVVKETESDGTKKWVISQSEADNWRDPVTLIKNFERGFINGDCEDFGFLAQYFLSKLDPAVKSEVVQVGGHATCVWVEKNKNGKFHARTLGGYGYDWNSYVRKKLPFGETESYGNEKIFNADGYKTIGEALNSVFDKYSDSYGKILVDTSNAPVVTIMEMQKIPNGQTRQIYRRGNLSGEFLN